MRKCGRWSLSPGVLGAVLVALAVVPTASGQPPQKGKDTIQALEAAWKARQSRFATVEMKWTSRETFLKGGISDSLPPLSSKESKLQLQPPEDTAFDVPYQFTLDGNKARCEYRGWQWYVMEGRFNATRWVSTFDGVFSKECHVEREGVQRWPVGIVIQKGAFAGARYGYLRAPFVFLRPVEPQFYGFDLEAFFLAARSAKVRGVNCMELQHRMQTGTLHLWVDPGRGYVVVRQLSVSNGIPSLQIDSDYREDARWGWLLNGWELTSMSRAGKITETHKCSVTELQVNAKASPGAFDLVFPPGSMVDDNVERTRWLVRDDGSKWMISRKESRLSYAELRASDPHAPAKWRWVSTGLALGATACLALFFYRRFRGRRTQPVQSPE